MAGPIETSTLRRRVDTRVRFWRGMNPVRPDWIQERHLADFVRKSKAVLTEGIIPIVVGTCRNLLEDDSSHKRDLVRLGQILDILVKECGLNVIEFVDRSDNALELAQAAIRQLEGNGLRDRVTVFAGTVKDKTYTFSHTSGNGLTALITAMQIACEYLEAGVDGIISPGGLVARHREHDVILFAGEHNVITGPAGETATELETLRIRQLEPFVFVEAGMDSQPIIHPDLFIVDPEILWQKVNSACSPDGTPRVSVKGLMAGNADLNLGPSSGVKLNEDSAGELFRQGAALIGASEIIGDAFKCSNDEFPWALSKIESAVKLARKLRDVNRSWAPKWFVDSRPVEIPFIS